MKTAGNILVTVFAFLLFFSGTFSNSGRITIEVEGLRNSQGTVRIGVYNEEEGYLKDKGVIRNETGSIKRNTCTLETGILPYGDYAMALLHDENNNKTMDYSWLQLPKEGFGFSNNPKIGMSAPSFQETKVQLNSCEKRITIKVKYM